MCSWTTQLQMGFRMGIRRSKKWVVSSEEMVMFALICMPSPWLPYMLPRSAVSFERKGGEGVGEMSH